MGLPAAAERDRVMPMTKITPIFIPVGEVDLGVFRARGLLVKKITDAAGGYFWGHALDVDGGCLIFVPSVRSEQVA